MPKLRLTEIQQQNALLRQAISGSAGYFNLTPNDQAEIAGVKRATWYRRLKEPEDFTLKELRRMVRRYSWTAQVVGSFLGAKEDLK